MNTTKREIVIAISEDTGIPQLKVYKVVQKTLDLIMESLVKGKNVELRNFGVFEARTRKPRIGRNPAKPDQVVTIPARRVVKFKAGKVMRRCVLESVMPEPSEVDSSEISE